MIIERMMNVVIGFPDLPMPEAGVAALPQLGAIRVSGEQAAEFLQSQLTQDVESMPVRQARLAAHCNAKGRMLASFVVFRLADDDFVLVIGRDLLATTLRTLSIFVLRSRVVLHDASDDVVICGLVGASIEAARMATAGPTGEPGPIQPLVADLPPAGGMPLALWLGSTAATTPSGPSLDAGQWELATVRSGVAWLSASVAGAFVPQMLNYESVGGVSFSKGCYPGQEVVARSQFRGAVKRRAYVARTAGDAQAGDDVIRMGQAAQPCGLIAQAAPGPHGGAVVIASIQLSALESGDELRVKSAEGPLLTDLHMPYPLVEI